SKIEVPEDTVKSGDLSYEEVIKSFGEMPSTFKAFLPIVLPVILIGAGSVASVLGGEDGFTNVLKFFGSPTVALLIGVFAAFFLLPKWNEESLTGLIGEGLVSAAPILLITGAGGAFGRVITNSGVADLIAEMDLSALAGGSLFLLIPFLIAA